MVFKWHDARHTDKFLSLYRSYDFLYDNNNTFYKNKKLREAAYKEIIAQMKIPELTTFDIKSKIKTIRTNYKAKLDLVLRSERDAKDQSEVYVPRVFWFKKADEFLRPVVLRETENNVATFEEDTLYKGPEDNTTHQSDIDTCDIKLEDTGIQEPDTRESKSPTPEASSVSTISSDLLSLPPEPDTPPPPASKWDLPSNFAKSSNAYATYQKTKSLKHAQPKNNTDAKSHSTTKRGYPFTVLEQSVAKLQKTIEQHKEGVDDEFDLFGKSIALQLKRMPLERALICQENLQKVMNQERLLQR